MLNHYNSSVLWKGHLYGIHGAPGTNDDTYKDESMLRCVEFETGSVKWSKSGFGKGSLMLADGKLIILSERGELVVAEATPTGYKELARDHVIGGKCWTMPVLANGRIYCRNDRGNLVCFDVRVASLTPAR